MSLPPLEFPSLLPAPAESWHWPPPPFAWRFQPPPQNAVQPCRIESRAGTAVEGELVAMDVDAGRLDFRLTPGSAPVALPFAQFHRLTLTQPLLPSPTSPSAPQERVPAAAQERDYKVHLSERDGRLVGRTAGHVETAFGLFLFPPVDVDRGMLRVFVPRSAYTRYEFGPSAEELAMSQWIASPQALLEALERQAKAPVLPIGQALLNLGLVTPAQLEAALSRQPPDRPVPLGEMLVKGGLISKADLQTALGHKMGCPLVDLSRFPIDPKAARKLTLRTIIALRALPLLMDGPRLIVAVDRLARVAHLSNLHALAGMTVVPVLARKSQLRLALTGLIEQDVWSQAVPVQVNLLDTTT